MIRIVIFIRFFVRIEDNINCFRDFLTFISFKMSWIAKNSKNLIQQNAKFHRRETIFVSSIFFCLHFVSECEIFWVKWLLSWKKVNVICFTCSLPLDFQTFLRFCYVRVVLTRYTTPLCPFFLKQCFTLSRNYYQVLGQNRLQSLIFE